MILIDRCNSCKYLKLFDNPLYNLFYFDPITLELTDKHPLRILIVALTKII